MKYNIQTLFLEKQHSDCFVFGIFEDFKLCFSIKKIDKDSNGYINQLIKNKDFFGKFNESLFLYSIPNVYSTKIILLGCGRRKDLNADRYKQLFQTSIKIIKNLSLKTITYFLTELNIEGIDIYWKVRFAISAIEDSLYSFKNFKTYTNKKKITSLIDSINFSVFSDNDIVLGNNAIKYGLAISKGKKISKDLSNMPPNICNPTYLATKAIELSQNYPNCITIDIVNYQDMKNLGMNAYVSVGMGSNNKSLMSIIKYKGSTDNKVKNIVLIGKGVTFDAGGISIKPSSKLDEMKFDMSGASIVFGLMSIVAELQLPLNLIGVLAASENMVGSKSFRPGDILTTMSGKTVEILDTDAEGRLILCDVLTYVDKFNPDIVLDIATLTGACVVALGTYVTGVLSNNKNLVQDLQRSSNQTGDLIWEMPLFKEYYKDLNSNIADMTNIGNNSAGMITAACFLSNFAKKYIWAHLDIAGTAWISGKNKGSTGRPIDLLSQFLINQSKNNIL